MLVTSKTQQCMSIKMCTQDSFSMIGKEKAKKKKKDKLKCRAMLARLNTDSIMALP